MMDRDTRLTKIQSLLASKSAAAEARLSEELKGVERIFRQSADFDELEASLQLLGVLGGKFGGAVLPNLEKFVAEIPLRSLTENGESIPESRRKYRTAGHLVRTAIDATHSIRYLYTERLVRFLFALHSDSADTNVRSKAAEELKSLARYDLLVFRQVGAQPQAEIVQFLETLSDSELLKNLSLVESLLQNTLSPTTEGHAWSYKALTITRGGVVAEDGVPEMRTASIRLLKRLYALDAGVDHKRRVLRTLNTATRREPVQDQATLDMFERDSKDVLAFLGDLVSTEPLPVVQVIEHQAFWNFYHAATPAIELAALVVRDRIAVHAEYQIYKQLIGFDAIFGDWIALRSKEEAWDYTDTKRKAEAQKYIAAINENTSSEWKTRILEFSKTRSEDLATFPVFYFFLEELGRTHPGLALELISDRGETMSPFFIALLTGLWRSDQAARTATMVQDWIAAGKNLTAVAKSFYQDDGSRLEILSLDLLKAIELDLTSTIITVMGVAASLFGRGVIGAKEIFIRGLTDLNERKDGRWAREVWFNRDFRALARNMDGLERELALSSLAHLQELNYEAEAVLLALGENQPAVLLEFLMGRIREEVEARTREPSDGELEERFRFEAIPYHFEQVGELLSKEPLKVLSALKNGFTANAADWFPYSSQARLIKHVFRNFDQRLEGLLENSVQTGEDTDVQFALAVARSFEGGAPILGLCKAIVRVVPERSDAWNKLSSALLTTGLVMGEFGVAEAYERRRAGLEEWRKDSDRRVRAFSDWMIEILDPLIQNDRQRAKEEIAIRKYRYGAGVDDE